MTIQLIDVVEQREHQRELERYRAQVAERDATQDFSTPYPKYPAPPEPFSDSADPALVGARERAFAMPISPMPAGSDPRPPEQLVRDGSSAGEVKGFESSWSCDTDSAPFKLVR